MTSLRSDLPTIPTTRLDQADPVLMEDVADAVATFVRNDTLAARVVVLRGTAPPELLAPDAR